MKRYLKIVHIRLLMVVSLCVLAGLVAGIRYSSRDKDDRPVTAESGIPTATGGTGIIAEKVTVSAQALPDDTASQVLPIPNGPVDKLKTLEQAQELSDWVPVQEKTAPGTFKRMKIVRTEMKYPLVRIEETLIDDSRKTDLQPGKVVRRVAMVADHIVVRLEKGIQEHDLNQLATKYGATIRRKQHAPDTYLVKIVSAGPGYMARSLGAFSAEPDVAYAEPDYIVCALETIPNDPQFSGLWGLHNTGQTGGQIDADIDAPDAWDIYTGSSNMLVAVIDTGIDYDHPELAPHIYINPGETGLDTNGMGMATNGVDDDANGYIDDWRGWNFAGDDNNPDDDHFHGTHCAGTIGARGDNGIGVAGVNWHIRMVALKFLNAGGAGASSDAVDAIYYATSLGVKLTSNSWGGGGFSQSMLDAISDANMHEVLFVAAAGNDGESSLHYPAGYTSDNIISVAASDHSDSLASFSNFGSFWVDLAAPGVKILSTFPTNVTSSMSSYGLAPDYGTISGTSMACPHVAGAAALVWGLTRMALA